MSKENVVRFEKQLLKDEELQKKIKETFETFKNNLEGDALPDDKEVFDVVAPVAKEAGFEFSYEDYVEAKKAAAEGEIDLDEMKAVAGGANEEEGWGACVGIGWGYGGKSVDEIFGTTYCYYFGVGWSL